MTKEPQDAPAEQVPEVTGLPGAPMLPDHLAKELDKHLKADKAKKTKKAHGGKESPEASEDAGLQDEATTSSTTVPQPVDDADIETLDDPQINTAVDDIVRHEADEVLASEDAARNPAPTKPHGFWRRFGHFFAAWWHNKWARNITIILFVAAITAVAVLPSARYFTLNAVGVRSSISLTVIDISTQLPLKNVTVSIDDAQAKTDAKGQVKLSEVRL